MNQLPKSTPYLGKVFVDDIAPGRKSAELRKNTFYTLPAAEVKRWEAATASVAEEWVKEVTSKGFDGKRLLDEAKAACK